MVTVKYCLTPCNNLNHKITPKVIQIKLEDVVVASALDDM